jgi:hypothetical protein
MIDKWRGQLGEKIGLSIKRIVNLPDLSQLFGRKKSGDKLHFLVVFGNDVISTRNLLVVACHHIW